jgi:hypothetical protein
MRDCKHIHTRYVRVHRGTECHLSVQCTDCNALVKLQEHHNRLLIKAFEIPNGTPVFDIDYSEVPRHV